MTEWPCHHATHTPSSLADDKTHSNPLSAYTSWGAGCCYQTLFQQVGSLIVTAPLHRTCDTAWENSQENLFGAWVEWNTQHRDQQHSNEIYIIITHMYKTGLTCKCMQYMHVIVNRSMHKPHLPWSSIKVPEKRLRKAGGSFPSTTLTCGPFSLSSSTVIRADAPFSFNDEFSPTYKIHKCRARHNSFRQYHEGDTITYCLLWQAKLINEAATNNAWTLLN